MKNTFTKNNSIISTEINSQSQSLSNTFDQVISALQMDQNINHLENSNVLNDMILIKQSIIYFNQLSKNYSNIIQDKKNILSKKKKQYKDKLSSIQMHKNNLLNLKMIKQSLQEKINKTQSQVFKKSKLFKSLKKKISQKKRLISVEIQKRMSHSINKYQYSIPISNGYFRRFPNIPAMHTSFAIPHYGVYYHPNNNSYFYPRNNLFVQHNQNQFNVKNSNPQIQLRNQSSLFSDNENIIYSNQHQNDIINSKVISKKIDSKINKFQSKSQQQGFNNLKQQKSIKTSQCKPIQNINKTRQKNTQKNQIPNYNPMMMSQSEIVINYDTLPDQQKQDNDDKRKPTKNGLSLKKSSHLKPINQYNKQSKFNENLNISESSSVAFEIQQGQDPPLQKQLPLKIPQQNNDDIMEISLAIRSKLQLNQKNKQKQQINNLQQNYNGANNIYLKTISTRSQIKNKQKQLINNLQQNYNGANNIYLKTTSTRSQVKNK